MIRLVTALTRRLVEVRRDFGTCRLPFIRREIPSSFHGLLDPGDGVTLTDLEHIRECQHIPLGTPPKTSQQHVAFEPAITS